jgi:hypothetical protein
MDSVFEIPGLGLRFGLDAIIGLVPGAGDLASSLASFYILAGAHRMGVSRVTLTRMTLNTAIDLAIGALPLVGDLFDAWWKANERNVGLVRRDVLATPAESRKHRAGDALFVAFLMAIIAVVLIGSLALAYLAVAWLVSAFRTAGA